MIIFLLGLADLICAIGVLAIHYNFNILGLNLALFIVFYLFGKSIIFRGDFASIIDGVCAVYVLLMLLGLRTAFVWIIFIYFLQKSILSFKP